MRRTAKPRGTKSVQVCAMVIWAHLDSLVLQVQRADLAAQGNAPEHQVVALAP